MIDGIVWDRLYDNRYIDRKYIDMNINRYSRGVKRYRRKREKTNQLRTQ